jgi:spore maturation protein CgeB
LEDVADAFRGDGHVVASGVVRHPSLGRRLQRAVGAPMAEEIARTAERFGPDLILAVGGFHTPASVLAALRESRSRAPIVGWVGDAFGTEAAPLAALYDLVAHTDSALEARHRTLGLAAPSLWLPHAANPHRAAPRRERADDMVFIAAASPERRRVVEGIDEPIVLYGPGWRVLPPARHRVAGGRVSHRRLAGLYASHAASLNVRNADNVVAGLNQRSFDPYLFGAAVVTDDQPDLASCFDVGREVLVFRSAEELNAVHARVRRQAGFAATVAERGLARIQAEHTFAHRLATIMRAVN